MPLKGKDRDQDPNVDMDLVAEQELSRLQRQFRIMEGDKSAFSGDMDAKIKRKRKIIKILQREQENIIADLQIATSEAKKKQDDQLNVHLKNLLKEHDDVENKVEKQKAHLTELDYQIKKIGEEVAKIKMKTITDEMCQARILAGQRSVAMLENRLEVAVKKFNIVVAENFALRQEIDHLLIERAHFNELWQKLIGNLNNGKKFMLDLIEQATLAYDQREESCNKLQALRQRGQHDLAQHTVQMREMKRKLDHDKKLHDFLGTKGQKRILQDLESRLAKKRLQAKENMEKQLALYKETLAQIQDFCGESDIERLISQYIKQEEENFALFNYVNELNFESEKLNLAIIELRKDIDTQRELHEQRAEQQKNSLAALEETLNEATQKVEDSQTKLKTFDSDLEKILKAVEGLFNLLKCSNAPILELLGDTTSINNYNVMLHIGLIEKRVSELMQIVYFKEKTAIERTRRGRLPPSTMFRPDNRSRYKHTNIQTLVPTQPCPLCVEQEKVSDVIDSLQYAESKDEVAENLEIRLALPHALDRLHNVSACHLPQSRKIIQQRYQ